MMYMFKATLYYLQMYLRCFKVDDKYLEKIHNFHSDLPFLPEIMKINLQQACV